MYAIITWRIEEMYDYYITLEDELVYKLNPCEASGMDTVRSNP